MSLRPRCFLTEYEGSWLHPQIELLSLRIPFAQYGEAKKLYDERKKLRDLRKAELEQAQRQNEPLERKRE